MLFGLISVSSPNPATPVSFPRVISSREGYRDGYTRTHVITSTYLAVSLGDNYIMAYYNMIMKICWHQILAAFIV